MTASVPPRHLPPPILPAKVVAQTRIKALRADLANEQSTRVRAVLEYEIGALTELRLQDPAHAVEHYRAAVSSNPSFRPPLFALARILQTERSWSELAEVQEQLAETGLPHERSSALVQLAVTLEDRMGDVEAAHERFEQAQHASTDAHAALLMLETQLRSLGEHARADDVIIVRAQRALDPMLRAVLLTESADIAEARGDIDAAIESLVQAAALAVRRVPVLMRLSLLARKHGRARVASHAYHELGTLLQRCASGETFEGSRDVMQSLGSPNATRSWAAFCYREAARHFVLHDPARAKALYDNAEACQPEDVMLAFEQMQACELSGDFDAARARARALLPLADRARAAALHFHLAELAERQDDRLQARESLRAALASDPDEPVVLAVLEDALFDDGELGLLREHLERRAAGSDTTEDADVALTRAACIAQHDERARPEALRLHRLLVGQARSEHERAGRLREWYGTGLRFGDLHAQRQALDALLELQLGEAERAALARSKYLVLRAADEPVAAQRALYDALEDPSCESWAPYCALVSAAGRSDMLLLARAHEKLQAQAEHDEQACAHACARGRALARAGQHDEALAVLRNALTLSPSNDYAVALLEELLLARGEATEAVFMLREAASAEHNARKSELARLHAGAAAEAAGHYELAARSYEEAVDRDAMALSALWSLLRLGQRSGDARLRLSAHEGLALREGALGQAGIENLELGERYDAIGKPELAIAPLEAALASEQVGQEAALAITLLPRNAFDAELRPAALLRLSERADRKTRAELEHERLAELAAITPTRARDELLAAARLKEPAHADAVLALLLCEEPAERAAALRRLAALSSDDDARAELQLQARRTFAVAASQQKPAKRTARTVFDRAALPEEAFDEALELMQGSPLSLAAALAVDEATTDDDHPARRLTALKARLLHAGQGPTRLPLMAALARAFLATDQPHDAAALARQVLHEDAADLSSWDTLRVAGRAIGDIDSVVVACDTLAAHAYGEARALLLEEAAALLEERLERPAEAELRLRAALEADDANLAIFERLHDLLVDNRDLEGLVSLISTRVRVASSEAERMDLLYEQARLLRALGEREATLVCLDEVLGHEPDHVGALGLSAETHASLQDWPAAIAVLRTLAKSELPDAQRRLARQGAADFLERNVRDLGGAYHELYALHVEGLADVTLFVRMADLARRAGLFAEAVAALREAAQRSKPDACAGFERQAGEIERDDRHDNTAAAVAFRRALGALPTDIDACEQLAPLLQGEERAELRVSVHRAIVAELEREPGQPQQLRALRRLAALSHDRALDHVALAALVVLGHATDAELEAERSLRRRLPALPLAALDDALFAQLGGGAVTPGALTIARLGCKLWIELTADSPANYGVDKRHRIKQRQPNELRDGLFIWASSFGTQPNELYVGGSAPHAMEMLLEDGVSQPWIAGVELQLPLSSEQRSRIAEQGAAARIHVLPLVRLPKEAARDVLYGCLLALSVTLPQADAERCRSLAAQLEQRMTRAQRKTLEQSVAGLHEPTRELDALLDAVRLLALQTGLLASGDLVGTLQRTLPGPLDAASVLGDRVGLSLLRFWTSETALSLRRTLGLVP